jgi:nucleotidyltransferase/DNA polymerase involved in DNA repair
MMWSMVGHLDADCFYVSAERVRYGHLIGVPVGVIGNQGACVIAKSYEIKKAGIATGMPIWDALKNCPDGLYVKRDFRWYEILSRMMLEVMWEYWRGRTADPSASSPTQDIVPRRKFRRGDQ